MQCNLCSSYDFADMGKRKRVRCLTCNSLERSRVVGLFLERFNLLTKDTRVLHIAPEFGLAQHFLKIAGDNVTFADISPENYPALKNVQRIDLCSDLEKISNSAYDLIVHNHVLEHIPCNYTYVLYQLHRILSSEGRMLFSIPIMNDYYCSATSPHISKQERAVRFGQDDHIRSFGANDLEFTLGKIYSLDKNYDLTKVWSKEDLEKSNIPSEAWRGYSSHSVFSVGKHDYRLGTIP